MYIKQDPPLDSSPLLNTTDEVVLEKMDGELGKSYFIPHSAAIARIVSQLVDKSLTLWTLL
jgi:hypothetical protein